TPMRTSLITASANRPPGAFQSRFGWIRRAAGPDTRTARLSRGGWRSGGAARHLLGQCQCCTRGRSVDDPTAAARAARCQAGVAEAFELEPQRLALLDIDRLRQDPSPRPLAVQPIALDLLR